MKVKIYLTILLSVLVLLVLNATVYAANTDSRIESTARQSYVFKIYLQNDDIKIMSKNGAVTLSGIVLEESHKALAQETLAGLPGVKSVDNTLEVKGEVPEKNSDAWMITKVKTTLLFHRSVSAGTTEVEVRGGVVTLGGDAVSQAQKDLTTEYARDVEGVKDVKNEMTIKKNAKKTRTENRKIDDASITALVKMTLLYHRSTSALNTMVETNRGVVRLNGKASSATEVKLAAKYANDINGVKRVDNRMTVE